MTAIKPDVNPSSRYTIGKAAKILGVSRGMLYYHIRSGRIRIDVRKLNNKAVISGLAIMQIWSETIRNIQL